MSTNSPVSLESVRLAVAPLIERAGLRARDIDVRGPTLGKRFIIKRAATATLDERQTTDLCMDARRRPDDGWFQKDIKSPAGALIPAFLAGKDRGESDGLTRAARALRLIDDSRTHDVAKVANALVHEWRELVVVQYSPTKNERKHQTIRDLGIDIDKLQEAFEDMVKRAPGATRA